MSDRIEDGGPAYPVPGNQPHPQMNGMSLRDWFAGQAILEVLASHETRDMYDAATTAYQIADAMIAARKGGQS